MKSLSGFSTLTAIYFVAAGGSLSLAWVGWPSNGPSRTSGTFEGMRFISDSLPENRYG